MSQQVCHSFIASSPSNFSVHISCMSKIIYIKIIYLNVDIYLKSLQNTFYTIEITYESLNQFLLILSAADTTIILHVTNIICGSVSNFFFAV